MSEKKYLSNLPMFGYFLCGDVLINKDVGWLYNGSRCSVFAAAAMV